MASKKKVVENREFLTIEDLKAQKAELEKKFGGAVYFGDDPDLEVVNLPLGIAPLDEALNGGFPFGRFSLIYGEEGTGKTTLCLFTVKEAQKQGLACAYIDLEKKLDPSWAKVIGVNIEDLVVCRPHSGEELVEILGDLVAANFGVIVIDSIAAIASQAELDADGDKKFMGEQARLVGALIKVLNQKNNMTLILMINQLREKIGVMFGNPESLPGGKAQRYFATMRVRVRRGSYIEEGDTKIGYNLRIIIDKDQHGTPFKEAEVPFYFTGKIDAEAALVATALSFNVITQKGPYYYFGEEKFLGKAGLIDAVRENEEFRINIQASLDKIKELDE